MSEQITKLPTICLLLRFCEWCIYSFN